MHASPMARHGFSYLHWRRVRSSIRMGRQRWTATTVLAWMLLSAVVLPASAQHGHGGAAEEETRPILGLVGTYAHAFAAESEPPTGESPEEHRAEESQVQWGAPTSAAECTELDGVGGAAWYAGRSITISQTEAGAYLAEPNPSECTPAESLAASPPVITAWAQLQTQTLIRRCGELDLTLSLERATEEDEPDRLLATVRLPNGGYCSTMLMRDGKLAVVAGSAQPARWETWLYAMLSCTLSSIVSLVGISLLWCQRTRVEAYLPELLALSCGTFLGSVFFSILPETGEVLGFELEVTAVVFGGVLFGMLSEGASHRLSEYLVTKATGRREPPEVHGRGQSNSAQPASLEMVSNGQSVADHETTCGVAHQPPVIIHMEDADSHVAAPKKGASQTTAQSDAQPQHSPVHCNHAGLGPDDADLADHVHENSIGEYEGGKVDSVPSRVEPLPASETATSLYATRLAQYRHLAIVNCVGDCLHNFIDGTLIGATFLVDVRIGWTTTVAIVLHELPQELADYTTLIKAGLTPGQALLANLGVSLTSFLGAIIAVAVGSSFADEVVEILPFAAGLFLYLALACLMPEILKTRGNKRYAVAAAFCLGVALMATLLAVPWKA